MSPGDGNLLLLLHFKGKEGNRKGIVMMKKPTNYLLNRMPEESRAHGIFSSLLPVVAKDTEISGRIQS